MNRVLLPLQIDDVAPVWGATAHRLDGQTMGTTWQVQWVATGASSSEAVRAAVQQELDLVVNQMSTWLPSSDLERFNRADAGTPHVVPEAMATVLHAALWLADASGGAFNPAAGTLVNLWGFGPSPRYTDPGFVPPTEAAVQQALACKLAQPVLGCGAPPDPPTGWSAADFSAIAKGYAVDRVSQRLAAMGLHHTLVEVGGELRGQGLHLAGQPWWVDLESPLGAAQRLPVTRLALHGLSVATSGDYRRVYTHGGTRWPHTIDPRNGRPVAHGLASVSVVHSECLWADAWSTALTVLGHGPGMALATEHGIAALFVQRQVDGSLTETMSPAMDALAG